MRIALKSVVFIVPLLIWQAIELFALPIDHFSFRPWEAMLAKRIQTLPGPFYPNQDLLKWSAGDLDRKGPRNKLIRFKTDSKGFRNTQDYSADAPPKIVIIGDSNIVGSHTDQKDLLTEQLSLLCSCRVFDASSGLPDNLYAYIRDPDFQKTNPDWVIVEFRRETLARGSISKPPECLFADRFRGDSRGYGNCSFPGHLDKVLDEWLSAEDWKTSILLDRLLKQPGYNRLRASLGLTGGAPSPRKDRDRIAEKVAIKDSIEVLSWYRDSFADRGSKMAVVVLGGNDPELDRDFYWASTELISRGIPVVDFANSDTAKDFDMKKFWLKEDSHWTDEAILATADRLNDVIRRREGDL